MAKPNREHGIEHEPHMQPAGHELDPSEIQAEQLLNSERQKESDADRVEHGVWEEPALSPDLAGSPQENQLTYACWLESCIERTTILQSMRTTLLVALAAGPWGILGAVWASLHGFGWQGLGSNGIGLMAVLVFGPVTEEVVKVSTAWWVVEKRPYLFQTVPQILFCAACGGFAFAGIENLIYLYVYVPEHTLAFLKFRWTVCVGLHVACSLVAGVGLARIWDNAIRNRQRPKLALGIPWLVIAITGHGLYNLSVSLAELAGWLDFLHEPAS